MRYLFLSASFILNTLFLFSQDKENPVVTVTVNGVSHTIQVGDTVHLGYGSNPYGSFMYIKFGTDGSLSKDHAGKSVVVHRIKHFPKFDLYQVIMKDRLVGMPWIEIQQGVCPAVEKKEILGFNSTYFNKD